MTTIEFSIPPYMVVILCAAWTIGGLLRIVNWFQDRKLRKLKEERDA